MISFILSIEYDVSQSEIEDILNTKKLNFYRLEGVVTRYVVESGFSKASEIEDFLVNLPEVRSVSHLNDHSGPRKSRRR